MWDLIVSVPDHCLSFYFVAIQDAVSYSNQYAHLFGYRRKSLAMLTRINIFQNSFDITVGKMTTV